MADSGTILQLTTNVDAQDAISQIQHLASVLEELQNVFKNAGIQGGSVFSKITNALKDVRDIDTKNITQNLDKVLEALRKLTQSSFNISGLNRSWNVDNRNFADELKGALESVRPEAEAAVKSIGDYASRARNILRGLQEDTGVSPEFFKQFKDTAKSSIQALEHFLNGIDLSNLKKTFDINSQELLLSKDTVAKAEAQLEELRRVAADEINQIKAVLDGTDLSSNAFDKAFQSMFNYKLNDTRIDVLENFVAKAREAQNAAAEELGKSELAQRFKKELEEIRTAASSVSAKMDAETSRLAQSFDKIKSEFNKKGTIGIHIDTEAISKKIQEAQQQIADWKNSITEIKSSGIRLGLPSTEIQKAENSIKALNDEVAKYEKLLVSIQSHSAFTKEAQSQTEKYKELLSSLKSQLEQLSSGKNTNFGLAISTQERSVGSLREKVEKLQDVLRNRKATFTNDEQTQILQAQIEGTKKLIALREQYIELFKTERDRQQKITFEVNLSQLKEEGQKALDAIKQGLVSLGADISKYLAEAKAKGMDVDVTSPLLARKSEYEKLLSEMEKTVEDTETRIREAREAGDNQQNKLLEEKLSHQIKQRQLYRNAVININNAINEAESIQTQTDAKKREKEELDARTTEYKKFRAKILNIIHELKEAQSSDNTNSAGLTNFFQTNFEKASKALEDLKRQVNEYYAQVSKIYEQKIISDEDRKKAEKLSSAIGAIEPKIKTLESLAGNFSRRLEEAQDNSKQIALANEEAMKAIEKRAESIRYAFGEVAKVFDWIYDKMVASFVPTITSLTKQLHSAFSGGNIFKSFFKDSFDMGGQFEAQMIRVKVVSNAGREDLKQLIDTARDMGEKLPLTAKQVAEGMEILAQRGHKTSEILSLINDVSNLSISQNIEMAKSAELLGSTIVNFGKSLSEASVITDMFNNASNNSALNINRLMEAMRYVAPAAGSLGYALEDMIGVLQVMSNAGLTGEMMGTGLAHMITKIGGEAEILGVRTRYLDGTARSLVDILKELHDRGTSVSDVYNTFGQRTTKAATAAIQGANALDELIKKSKEAGTTQKAVNEMMQTWPNTVLKFQSAVQELHIEVFSQLEDESKKLVNNFTGLLRVFTDWVKEKKVVNQLLKSFMEGLSYKLPSEGTFRAFLDSIDIEGFKEIASEFGRYFKNLIDLIKTYGPVAGTIIKTIYKNFVLFDRITYYISIASNAMSKFLAVFIASKVIPPILTATGKGLAAISGGATIASTGLLGLSGILSKLFAFLLNWKVVAIAIAGLALAGITGFSQWSEQAQDHKRKITEAYEDIKKSGEEIHKELQNYGGTGYEVHVDVITSNAFVRFNDLKTKAEENLADLRGVIAEEAYKIDAILQEMGASNDLQKIMHDTSIETENVIKILNSYRRNGLIFFDTTQLRAIEEYRAKLMGLYDTQKAQQKKTTTMQEVFNQSLRDAVKSIDTDAISLGRIEGIENLKEVEDEITTLNSILSDNSKLNMWADRLTQALADVEVYKTLTPLERHILNIAANSTKMGLDVRTAMQQVKQDFSEFQTKLKELDLSNPAKQAEAMAKQITTHINDAIKSFSNVSTSLEIFNTQGLFSRFELEGEAIKSAQASLEKYSKELAKQHGYSEDAARVIILDQLQKAIESATDEQARYNLELIKYGKAGVAKGLFSEFTQEARDFKLLQEHLADATNNSKYLNTSLVSVIQNLQEMLTRTNAIDTRTGRLNETWMKLKDTITSTISAELERITDVASTLAKHMDNIDFDKLSLSMKPLLSGMKPIDDMTGKINEGFIKALDTLKQLRDMKFSQAEKQLTYLMEAAKRGYMSYKDLDKFWDRNKKDIITQAVTEVGDPKSYPDLKSYYVAVATAVEMAADKMGILGQYAYDVRKNFASFKIERVGEAFVRIANDADGVTGAYNRMSASFRDGIQSISNISFPNLNESVIAPLQRIASTINTIFNKAFFGITNEQDKALSTFAKALNTIGKGANFDTLIIKKVEEIKKVFSGLQYQKYFEQFDKVAQIERSARQDDTLSKAAEELLKNLKLVGGNYGEVLKEAFNKFKTSFDQIAQKPDFTKNFSAIADVFGGKIQAVIKEIQQAGKTEIFSKEITEWQNVLKQLQELKNEASRGNKNFSFTQNQNQSTTPQSQGVVRFEVDGKNVLDRIGAILTSQNQTLSSSILKFGKEITDASIVLKSASEILGEASKNMSQKQSDQKSNNQPQVINIDGLEEAIRKFSASADNLSSALNQPERDTNRDTQSIVSAIEKQGGSIQEAVKAIVAQDTFNKILTAVSQEKEIKVETVVDFAKVIQAINEVKGVIPASSDIKVTLDAKEFVQAVAILQRIYSQPQTITVDMSELRNELTEIASKEIPEIDTTGIEKAISNISVQTDTESLKDLKRAIEALSQSIENFTHSAHGLKNAVYSEQGVPSGIGSDELALALTPLNETLHGIITELQANGQSVNLTPLIEQIKVLAENVRQPANVTFNIDTVQARNTNEATTSLSQAMGMYARQQNMGWNINA